MSGYIFISYHDGDRTYVESLVEYLTSLNFVIDPTVFERPRADKEITEHIRGCAAFIPIISTNTHHTKWVNRETMLADEFGKPILPIRLGGEPLLRIIDLPHEVIDKNHRPGQDFVDRLRRATTVAPPLPERIVHVIDDITRGDDLIRYAVHAQIHHVEANLTDVAKAIGLDEAELNDYLAGRRQFTVPMLRDLDDVFVALGGRNSRTGGLAQFGVRMRELTDRAGVAAKIPPSWTREILDARADDELHVLIQATTLLTNFVVAHRANRPSASIRGPFAHEIAQVAAQLILIAGGPPTPRHIEAQILLGSLAKYAFEIVSEQLEWSLRTSPLGFRTWRAVTKLVTIAREDSKQGDDDLARRLRAWLPGLIAMTRALRLESVYPGRSLDLELLISIPVDWTKAHELVTAELQHRAFDPEATLRERGMAVMGLWQRARDTPDGAPRMTGDEFTELAARLRSADDPAWREDIATGLDWVATTLERVVSKNVPVCNDWPTAEEIDEDWYTAVMNAAADLARADIPESVAPATRSLFLHLLLQNAGVERRRAIDTLTAGGLSEAVARALGRLLFDERREPWLRIRAVFALGFMQLRNIDAENALVLACRRAGDAILAGAPSRSQITELQTGLFALGDILGVKGGDEDAARIRPTLRRLLVTLVSQNLTQEPVRYPLARALVYLLTYTAQARPRSGAIDLSEELLQKLTTHPDRVTKNFSEWALGFRFGEAGEIRSLLDGMI